MEYQELRRALEEQKEEMTQQERMEAYLSGEEVDHLPCAMLGEDPMIGEIYGYTTRQVGERFDSRTGLTFSWGMFGFQIVLSGAWDRLCSRVCFERLYRFGETGGR